MEEKTKSKNKKQKVILLAIILLLCLSGVGVIFLLNRGGNSEETKKVVLTSEWDISWYDEDEKEYIITTKEQLLGLADLSQEIDFKGKTIKLGADIVINEGSAEDWKEEAPELNWKPIGRDKMPYNGTFDGQGHTISGLYCNNSDDLTGLFAATDGESKVMNFSIVNSYYKMRGDQGVGAVAGRGSGLYSQLYSDAIIECEGWYAGGIMGYKKYNGDCIISECWFDGRINVTGRMAGGIVGAAYTGGCTIQHCHNTGDIYSTFPGPQAATIGGIVGLVSQRLIITDCFNKGSLANEVGRPEVGTIIGAIAANGDVTSGLIWSTNEGAPTSVGGTNQDASVRGTFFQLPEELLTGFNAYQRTDLNFDKYWAVVEEGTPMLQCFADSVPSVEGLARSMEADTSWYDVTALESVITTPEQLKGFAYLAASGETFYGKTIKLGADIKYNEGNASNYQKDIPLNLWIPVDGFMGTFDGQGHSISGLYVGGAVTHVGFFALTEKQATVKNFKILNSCFVSTDTSNNYGVGSVAGGGGGTIERIYSDAIIVSSARYGGGIIGLFNRDGSISECWFDGEVAIKGRRSAGIAGACTDYYVKGNPIHTTTKISHCLNTGYIHRTDTVATDSATSAGIVGAIHNTAIIEDCFSSGVVMSPKYLDKGFDELGAIVSAIAAEGNGTIKNCWGTTECFKKVITTIKKESVSNISLSSVLEEAMLIGYDAVQMTTLNFNKYWAVDLDGTPVLKYFAKSVPSIAGMVIPDTSWYSDKKSEFVITTVEQLYGFSILANSGITFEGKTVKLGNSLTVNTGDASSWATAAPSNKWFPIKEFAGTFDGQGHTISGLYGKATKDSILGMGLFAKTNTNAIIQNVSVKNTYFETHAIYGLSAISSRGNGTFKNIYTDAILNNYGGSLTGGILGITLHGKVVIDNCWFNGSITDIGRRSGGILAYVNGVTDSVTVSNCLYTGSMKRSGETANDNMSLYGGIVGTATGVITVTDCVSDGSFASDRTKNADIMGSLIGETTGKGTFTFADLYGTSGSCAKPVGNNGAKCNVSGCIKMEDKYMEDANACLFTMLDYSNYWVARKDNVPVLRSFAQGNELANVTMLCDTSWYSDDASSYTIKTVEQLYGLTALACSHTFAGKTVRLQEGKNFQINTGTAPNLNVAYEWMPIQNFAGTFDGQQATISGLYGSAPATSLVGMGLFAATEKNALVQNVKIANSYFETNAIYGLSAVSSRGGGTFKNIYAGTDVYLNNLCGGLTGGILGIALKGSANISNCWFAGHITDVGQRSGGIVGHTNDQTVSVEHCLFSGSLTRVGSNVNKNVALFGGIAGTARGTVKMNDCLSVGVIATERTEPAEIMGSILGETSGTKKITLSNLFGDADKWTKAVGNNGSKADASDCHMVNNENLLGIKGYYNTELDFADYWAAVSGKTPELQDFAGTGAMQVAGLMKKKTTWFDEENNCGTIASAEELYGFELLASEGAFDQNTVITLGADITVNTLPEDKTIQYWGDTANAPAYEWTPILNYAGTFNGKGHTISGLYGVQNADIGVGMGLFANTVATTRISDFTLDKCYFEIQGTAGIGAVVSLGGGVIEKVHVGENVWLRESVKTGDNNKATKGGGIIGEANKTTKISKCWFEGRITSWGKNIGGMVGVVRTGATVTVEHSHSDGTVERVGGVNKNGGVGGICGQIERGNTLTINDTLHTGTVTSDRSGGDILGLFVASVPNANSNGTAKLNITASYSTPSGTLTNIVGEATNAIAAYNTGAWNVEKSAITGTSIDKTKVLLNFSSVWMMQSENTPILKCYLTIGADTDWFNPVKNSGTISNAKELYGFAELASEGAFNDTTKIYLGADITVNTLPEGQTIQYWSDGANAPIDTWTPIVDFAGNFDGKGFTIRGLYGIQDVNNGIGMGLFANTVATTNISDFTLDNCYFEIQGTEGIGAVVSKGGGTIEEVHVGKNVWLREAVKTSDVNKATKGGGIIGEANKTTKISKCWFEGRITSWGKNIGGMVGVVRTGAIVTVEHSHSDGTVERVGGVNKNGGVGGICGQIERGNTLTINDTLHTGTVTSDRSGGDILGLFVASVPNANSNGTAKLNITASYSTPSGTLTNIVGEATNAVATYNTGAWNVEKSAITGTTIDKTKVLLNFDKVWMMQSEGTPVLKCYFSDEEDVDTTWFNNQTNTGTISNVKQLYGFVQLASEGVFNDKTVISLGGDITVNTLPEGQTIQYWGDSLNAPIDTWTPIVNFAGEFNGRGFAIRGLYGIQDENTGLGMGLFANTVASTYIHDITLDDCYFEIQGTEGIGAVVSKGGGIIEKVHIGENVWLREAVKTSDVNKATKGGGIIGEANKTTKISKCWFEGRITSWGKNFGGMIGVVRTGATVTVEHSHSDGIVERIGGKNKNGGVGGICGQIERGNTLTLNDTLHTGTVTSDRSGGDILGLFVASVPNANSNGTARLNITASYSTPSGTLTNIVGEASDALVAYNTGAWNVESSAITGTQLDFNTIWKMIGGTPILQCFQ